MAREVEWIGGPHDGERLTIPDSMREVRMTLLNANPRFLHLHSPGDTVETLEMEFPVRDGKILWWEGRESNKPGGGPWSATHRERDDG